MERTWSVTYEELSWAELSPGEAELLKAAEAAAQKAYAPYSGFPVGAAARLIAGEIYTANNQENAAYPSGLCAERVLLFYLGAQGLVPQIQALAVCAPKLPHPVMPCGACRQVLHEYQEISQKRWTLIFAGNSQRVYRFIGVELLLPFAFVWRPA